ncbi:MAG: Rieske (2Fe-2S) protein [Sphingomonadales bacterium 63-6]|nr:MAG: Rieske (2Fe-2S) protein [Sphingomonadales bacterium 63-6]
MLTSQQAVFRNFWYATVLLEDLADGPVPFRILGEDIVLFLDAEGKPAALRDRCCHRTAKLSKGWCSKGEIVCGYHGWQYNRDGEVTRVPQQRVAQESSKFRVESYKCQARYGYAWVCLGEPVSDIPEILEDEDPAYRRIQQFNEVWHTSALRFMENSFDNAHFAFVHKGTFGNMEQPVPKKYAVTETDFGFEADAVVDILNPVESHRVTGTTDPEIERCLRNRWHMPFCRRLDIEYPTGLRHIIFNCATPIDDKSIHIAQILYRNDTEEQCSAQELIAWDQSVIDEDKEVLESTDYDAPLDSSTGEECSMVSDLPGLIIRKRLLRLLREHGEQEIRADHNLHYAGAGKVRAASKASGN